MSRSKEDLVIVGAGSAGISAVEAIRSREKDQPVTLISREIHRPYSPTILPYFIQGLLTEDKLPLREENFYRENKINLVLGEKVVKIDLPQKKVFLESGRDLAFEKLLLATGSVPIMPLGKGSDRVLGLRTLEDARRIRTLSEKGGKASILGAGLIGMKLAEIFREKGLEVTVVEAEDHILPNNYDADCAEIIKEIFLERGVKILTGLRAVNLDSGPGGVSLDLAEGKSIEADFLIVSVGARPATELAEDCGLACRQGILVDERMRTSGPDIFAAGDVAEAKDFWGEASVLSPILSEAVLQGKVAGLNMSGRESFYEGSLSVNAYNFFDNHAFSLGRIKEAGLETYVQSFPQERIYQKLVFEGGRLVGAVLLNRRVNLGILIGYLRKRIPYGPRKEDLVFDLETLSRRSILGS